MLEELFTTLWQTVQGLFVSIPLENALSVAYVVLNTAIQLILALFGFSSGGGGSILPF